MNKKTKNIGNKDTNIYLNELESLIDILDKIIPENDFTITEQFFEDNKDELTENILELMKNYIKNNPTEISEPDFHDNMIDNVKELITTQLEHIIKELDSDFEELFDDFIEDVCELFYSIYIPKRSHHSSIILEKPNKKLIEKQIKYLKSKPQPAQRTKDWYLFRYNLITASNAYKIFESQAVRNQIINEKCLPLSNNHIEDTVTEDINDDMKSIKIQQPVQMVNVNSTLHWGQKYEPLSVMIYEDKYKTKVGDFGCIQHDKYSFIGASPDGINIDPETDRYGRMLEIKNIVNREIDGIPKKEYWIQMQLQMEVCNLDECDFLETKFIEYEDYTSYVEDTFESETNKMTSKDGKQKGVIIYFHTKEGKPFYDYKPLNIISDEEIDNWSEEEINKYESEEYGYTFMKHIYWKLEVCSCVLVLRNKKWFQHNVGEIEKIWKIIEEQRKNNITLVSNKDKEQNEDTKQIKIDSMFTNTTTSTNTSQKTKRPTKSTKSKKSDLDKEEKSQGCLLNIGKDNKIIIIDTSIPNNTNTNTNTNTNMYESNSIIKIRTQSFDESKK